jgi:cytochrome b561
MRWRNTEDSYGSIAIALHWLVAVTVPGLFALGLWMRGLGYYDRWYDIAPGFHKGIGILLFLTLCARLAWRLANPSPGPLPSLRPFERRAAVVVHGLLYILLFATMLCGYLIPTADGRPISVFGLFQVPAILTDRDLDALRSTLGAWLAQIRLPGAAAAVTALPRQEDVAGAAHLYLACSVIVLASVHALAALKHHYIDRDRTLMRMLGRPSRR